MAKKLLHSIYLLSFLAITPYFQAQATEKTGFQIMQEVDQQSKKYATQKSEVLMVVTNKDGKERKRFFTNLRKISENTTRTLIKFYKPATVKGTALLTHKSEDKDETNQWIYLPSFKSIKKIDSNEQNKNFMGSDFTYSDIAGRRLNQDNHSLISENDKYYGIQSIPTDKKDTYSKIEYVIDKATMVPVKIVFYNNSDQKLKTLENKKITNIKGMHVVTKAIMENHIENSNSTVELSNIEVGIDISDNDVSIKNME